MAMGAPDWQGQRWKVEAIPRPNYIYPSGKVLFSDNFDSPILSWDTGGTGTEVVNLSTTRSFNAPNSVYLETGATADNSAWILKRFGLTASKKVGVQLSYTLSGYVNNVLSVELLDVNTVAISAAYIRFHGQNYRWEYYAPTIGWAAIPNFTQTVSRDGLTWNRLKIVVDFSTNNYVRLYSNNESTDMSNLGTNVGAAGVSNYLQLYIKILTPTNAVVKSYIDEIVVTEE